MILELCFGLFLLEIKRIQQMTLVSIKNKQDHTITREYGIDTIMVTDTCWIDQLLSKL